MLLPIVSSRKLMSRLILQKDKPFLGFIESFQKHEFSEYHSDICVYICEYNAEVFTSDIYEKLTFQEPSHIRKAVTKRRAEFLAGRLAAMVALESLNARDVSVSTGMHRNPIWPDGYVGSISHTSERAIAVVSQDHAVTFVGIDHEAIIPMNVATKIAPQILTSDEMQLYYQLSMSFTQFCTIIFSAKESLFKAIYPKVEMYINFSEARVTEICVTNKRFSIQLCSTLVSGELEVGKTFTGHLLSCGSFITTLISSN
ncbi:4'-phosphopantetheinyl transferase family protein [Vibrio tapetis]|uniref:Enterobactin synthase component D n=1 Tax=Vibrio tapetis subsp. tapetis TaxID=1671868 RepID=A0A2N8ZIU2_9VIBR|nr:4'-phosphopantetheinyl transferase superfamily protein [Vibrio tapetis]SON51835.1 Phosphopantetheinyl transferase component of siderophore synthetase [Vibrio tapetis subsp. tapetis]